MATKIFPTEFTTETPNVDDLQSFADVSDSNKAKKNTLGEIVVAGLGGANTDDLAEGVNNLYQTPGERAKLQSIETGAQVNQVTSVAGRQGPITLNLDDVEDSATRKVGDTAFTSTQNTNINLNNNHRVDTNNPHKVKKEQIGLTNVLDEQQLSTVAGSLDRLDEKSDVQLHLQDKYVIQDSSDLNNIKSITQQTDLIWKSSLIQNWNPSVNYYVFNFTASTTYDIHSYVYNGGNLYKCLVSHQSSSSFSSDLANGYWENVTSGGIGGGNILTAGNGAPTPGSGVNVGDIYLDLTNELLYYWDGTNWQLLSVGYTGDSVVFAGSGVPVGAGNEPGDLFVDFTNGDLYYWDGTNRQPITNGGSGGISFATTPTQGDRITFSVGTGANTIEESHITYDPVTDTVTFVGGEIVYEGVTQTYTGDNIVELGDGATITNNLDGDVTNNYGATYTENNTYTDGATINNSGDVINNHTNYNETNNYDANSTTNVSGGTHNYDNTTTVNNLGDLNVTNINQIVGTDTFTGDGVTTTRGPLTGREPGAVVTLTNTTTGTVLVEGVDYTIDPVTGVITFTPAIPNGEIISGVVTLTNKIPGNQVDGSITVIKKGVANFVATNTITVNDVDVVASSVITWTTDTAPAGFIEVITTNGSFTVNSSATETLQFNYVITS